MLLLTVYVRVNVTFKTSFITSEDINLINNNKQSCSKYKHTFSCKLFLNLFYHIISSQVDHLLSH